MEKALSFYLLLFINSTTVMVHAQNQLGAKLTSLGINSAAIKDIWNIESNVAGIVGLTRPTLAINYSKPLMVSDLSDQAMALVLPFRKIDAGLSLQRYGITSYHELKVGFALAKQLGAQFTIAIKANLHQLKIVNYGSTLGFSSDIGLLYSPSTQLTFGLSVNNPALSNFNRLSKQLNIPTIVQIGAAYQTSDKILIATSIRKNFGNPIDASLGIDYKILSQLSLRSGLSFKPFKHYVGFGLTYHSFALDVAIQSDVNVGYLPKISLAYAF